MKSKHVSIRDVAKHAGVSIATVSRVFNKTSFVSEELVEKVLTSARELGYHPNRVAQSLRKGQTKTIGFLIPDIVNPFFSSMVKGAEDFLKSLGYIILLCSSSGDREKENELLATFYSRKIDGLIAITLEENNPLIDSAISKKIPTILMDNIVNRPTISCVASDNYGGIKKLMNYLIETGHRSFVFLSGDPIIYSAKERLKAFKDTVEGRNDLDFEIVFGEYTYESGVEMVKKLKHIPDAVVCGNDMIAFGAMVELERRGFRIPEDVSVTGFDDILFSRMSRPPLTTVRQDAYLMGRVGAELLISAINEEIKNDVVLLETTLEIRGSTRERK